jgi:hypothetical protein
MRWNLSEVLIFISFMAKDIEHSSDPKDSNKTLRSGKHFQKQQDIKISILQLEAFLFQQRTG